MADVVRQSGKLDVFISYSRDDLAFVDQLEAALGLNGFAVTLDRSGIVGGEDWRRRLGSLIRDADTIVFVLSPNSASSKVCAWEVEEAARLGKRVLPVLSRALEGVQPPSQLADLDYVFFYAEPDVPGSGFGTGLVRLVAALETDLEWLREHTRLLQRATEWLTGGKPSNRLLSGKDVTQAKEWVGRRPANAPPPTMLHLDFIHDSEEHERTQAEVVRQNVEERERLVREREAAARRAESEARKAEEAARATEAVNIQLAAATRLQAEEQRKRYRIRNIAFALSVLTFLFAGSLLGLSRWSEAEKLREREIAQSRDERQQRQIERARETDELRREESEKAELRFEAERARRLIERGDATAGLNMLLEDLEPDSDPPGLSPIVPETHMMLATGLHGNLEREAVQLPAAAEIVAFGPDERMLAVADREVLLFLPGDREPRRRHLHGSKVLYAAFSRDGARVVTFAADRKVRLWGLGPGDAQVLEHAAGIVTARVDPTATVVAAAAKDGTITVWGIETGLQLATMKHDDEIVSIEWTSGSRKLFAATYGGSVRGWALPDGKELIRFEAGSRGDLTGMSVNADGTRALTTTGSNVAVLWNLVDGMRIAELAHGRPNPRARNTPREQIVAAAFSPSDNLLVTTGRDLRAAVWDTTRGTLLYSTLDHSNNIAGATFSPDGSRLMTWSQDRTARVYAACDGRELAVLRGHADEIRSARFSPDGCSVLTGSRDATARRWDLMRRPGQTILAERQCVPGAVRFGSEPCRAQVEHAKVQPPVQGAAITTDGTLAATGANDGRARIYDTATGVVVAELPRQSTPIRAMAYDATGARLAIGHGPPGPAPGTLRLYDWRAGREVLPGGVPHTGTIASVSFSPDRSRVLTATADGLAQVFDAASGRLLLRIETGPECLGIRCQLGGASWSPDGQHIATASYGHKACIWTAQSADEVVTKPIRCVGHDDRVYSVNWSSDGNRIVTASGDQTAVVWDARTGVAESVLNGEDFDFRSAEFMANDTQILTVNDDYALRFWYTETGREAARLAHRQSFITEVAIDKSGTRVLTGAFDGTARVWLLPATQEDIARLVRGSIARCLSPQQRRELNLDDTHVPSWCTGKMLRDPPRREVARQ